MNDTNKLIESYKKLNSLVLNSSYYGGVATSYLYVTKIYSNFYIKRSIYIPFYINGIFIKVIFFKKH